VISRRDRTRAELAAARESEEKLATLRLRNVRAKHEYNVSTGEDIIRTVVHQLGVLPTEYIRQIVTETLDACGGYAEAGYDPRDVAAALRWDRDGRPDRLW
jgi:hypothetical protein